VVSIYRDYKLTNTQVGSSLFSETNQCSITIATPLAILAPLVHLEGNQDAKHYHEHLDTVGDEFLLGQNGHRLDSPEWHSNLVHGLHKRHGGYPARNL
jgi:hypothetical protein